MLTSPTPELHAVSTAIAAALLALLLLTLALATGGSHLAFQTVRPPSEYTALLLDRGPHLRLEIALDDLFLCVYAAFFVRARSAMRCWSSSTSAPFWLGVLLLSALFDAAENANLLAMLALAERNLPIALGQIGAQSVVGQLKFLTNFAGLLALSFELPTTTRIERGLAGFLRWGQAPLGVAILVLPLPTARPIILARVLGFIAALAAFAHVASRRGRSACAI